MPNVKLVRAILLYILQYVQISSGLNHYFFELSCTHRQTHRQTDTLTDGHEYSIVALTIIKAICFTFSNKIHRKKFNDRQKIMEKKQQKSETQRSLLL